MHSAAARQPNALIWAARLAVAGPLLCIALVGALHVLEPEVNDSDAEDVPLAVEFRRRSGDVILSRGYPASLPFPES